MECGLSFNDPDCIVIGHGGGGKLTQRLIDKIFHPAFKNPYLDQNHDGSVFDIDRCKLAVSTDSFVVTPVFFPGGNIGDLAVNGTVNDIACCGAKPMFITAGFILEEGLPLSELKEIVDTMAQAARKAGVYIITGDTKVVERGKCDKLYINTTGIGVVMKNVDIDPAKATPGDIIICSGKIGAHGTTILSSRESLGFETTLKSDTKSLNNMLFHLLEKVEDIHVLRDPTRGGVSGTLNEIAQSSGVEIVLEESLLPIPEAVRGASEILGLDPLYIANEGVVLVILPEDESQKALDLMRSFPESKDACVIGKVSSKGKPLVKMKTDYGNYRIVDMLSGEQLPRIC